MKINPNQSDSQLFLFAIALLALIPVSIGFLLIIQPLETLLALGVISIVVFVIADCQPNSPNQESL